MVTRDVTKCARRAGALHAWCDAARQGDRRRHGQPPRRRHATASPAPSRTLRWLSMNARRAWTSTIEDVSEQHRRARAPGSAVARRSSQQVSPADLRAAQVLPARPTPRSATFPSRSRAPATPATSATRSGSTRSTRVAALGRADRGGHAVRHHARRASGRSTSRASRPG